MIGADVKVLFITWDGPETSYLEGLFLPIFAGLREHGYSFHVLQFGWGDMAQARREMACNYSEIPYRHITVQRQPRPLGPLWTAYRGGAHIAKAVREWDIEMLMPRSLMPALATLTMRGNHLPVVFDSDGIAADERVDFSGLSPESRTYSMYRSIEARMVRRADHVLTRTEATIPILVARGGPGVGEERFTVVGNGRDPNVFAPCSQEVSNATRQSLGIPLDALLLVYAGSLGDQYCPNAMLDLLEKVRHRYGNVHLLVLSGTPEPLRAHLASHPSLEQRVTFHTCSHAEVPAYLSCADVGLALRQQSFSMRGVSPIKIGEYLLCGLPVIATAGIGKAHVLKGAAGMTVDNQDDACLEAAADWVADLAAMDRCMVKDCSRQLGVEHFSLQSSVESYVRALSRVSPSLIVTR